MKTKYCINGLLAFVVALTLSCSKQNASKIKQLDNYLLYIEDVDGEGGIFSGNFGDIVAFNPVTSEKVLLTDDDYYDNHPSYSPSLKKVVFESKRINTDPHISGLTSDSDLFLLDIKSGKVSLINFNEFKSYKSELKFNKKQPCFDEQGVNLAFLTYNMQDVKKTNLFYYKKLKDSLVLLLDTLIDPLTYIFNNYDNKIFFTSKKKYTLGKSENYIGILDIQNRSVKKLLEESNKYFYLGDIKENKLLYLKLDISNFDDPRNYTINILDIESMRNKEILNSKNAGFREIMVPVFGKDDLIYFIANKSKIESKFDVDIYSLNLDSFNIKKITNDGHIKESLSFCN